MLVRVQKVDLLLQVQTGKVRLGPSSCLESKDGLGVQG